MYWYIPDARLGRLALVECSGCSNCRTLKGKSVASWSVNRRVLKAVLILSTGKKLIISTSSRVTVLRLLVLQEYSAAICDVRSSVKYLKDIWECWFHRRTKHACFLISLSVSFSIIKEHLKHELSTNFNLISSF